MIMKFQFLCFFSWIILFQSITFGLDSCNTYRNANEIIEIQPWVTSCKAVNPKDLDFIAKISDELNSNFTDRHDGNLQSIINAERQLKNHAGITIEDFVFPENSLSEEELSYNLNPIIEDLIFVELNNFLNFNFLLASKNIEMKDENSEEKISLIPMNSGFKRQLHQKLVDSKKILKYFQSNYPKAFICNVLNTQLVQTNYVFFNVHDKEEITLNDLLAADRIDSDEFMTVNNLISDENQIENQSKIQIEFNSEVVRLLNSEGFLNNEDNISCSGDDLSVIQPPSKYFDKECISSGIEDLFRLDANHLLEGIHVIGSGSGACHFKSARWESNGKSISSVYGKFKNRDGIDRQIKCKNISIISTATQISRIQFDINSCVEYK